MNAKCFNYNGINAFLFYFILFYILVIFAVMFMNGLEYYMDFTYWTIGDGIT